MVKFNFHVHTDYCDGKNSPEEMVLSAIDKKIKYLGFSSHAPVPFETDWTMKKENLYRYIEEINELKGKYKNKINILLGLEIDYFKDGGISHIPQKALESLDYWIGSVHYLNYFDNGIMWTVDYDKYELEQGIKESYDMNVRRAVNDYYENIGELALKHKPDIIGHLDLIKKSNQGNYFFDENEEWYKVAVNGCLHKIKHAGIIVEINSGGKNRGFIDEHYPSDWIIERLVHLEIPVTVSTDAHSVDDIDRDFEDIIKHIKNIGVKNLYYLTGSGIEKEKI